jgi:HEAT repeat protein
VRKAAIEQIGRLRFDHAFEPLARIYRQSERSPARLAALSAIGNIDVDEAVDLLLEVMKHGTDEERRQAIQAAARARSPRFFARARPLLPSAPPRLQEAIRAVAQSRPRA